MASKKLLECSFLIPTRRDPILSDGEPHDSEAWEWLDDQLFDLGGATRAMELYRGWYRDADTRERVTDLSKKFFVALPKSQLRDLRGILAEACLEFHQKCIYLSVAGHVEFVERPNHEEE